MGQALLVKAGGYQEKETEVPSLANACQILYKVRWPDGTPAKNLWVNCKDGTRNYNYHTDEKGEVLFSTNSGAANITITNKIDSDTDVIDVFNHGVVNIDAPIGLVKRLNVTLQYLNSTMTFVGGGSRYVALQNNQFNHLRIRMIGGGGGGCAGHDGGYTTGFGGSAGYITNKTVPSSQIVALQSYQIVVGSGGRGGQGSNNVFDLEDADSGYTGGTSTAFGVSAAGGGSGRQYNVGGGSALGANETSNYFNNSSKIGYGEDTPDSTFSAGGGGGGYKDTGNNSPPLTGGSPYGGDGAGTYYNSSGNLVLDRAGAGTYGGGGGAGFSWRSGNYPSSYYNGGKGGDGKIEITKVF